MGSIKVLGKRAARSNEHRGVPIVHGNHIIVLRVFAQETIHTLGGRHGTVTITELDIIAAFVQLDLEIVDVACRITLYIAPLKGKHAVRRSSRHLGFQLTA